MADAHIELAVTFDPAKPRLSFPLCMSAKLDGMPVKFTRTETGIDAVTRQGETVTSVERIKDHLGSLLRAVGDACTAEIWCAGVPFKTISGRVRAADAIPTEYYACVFDFMPAGASHLGWKARIDWFDELHVTYMRSRDDTCIDIIPYTLCTNELEMVVARTKIEKDYGRHLEGFVYKYADKLYQEGVRNVLFQKDKPKPTLDLRVTGFDEAIDKKTKLGLGRVGRINVELVTRTKSVIGEGDVVITRTVGVGPGALKHKEATKLWNDYVEHAGRACAKVWLEQLPLAEVEYMHDDSYEALRQPFFKCWRPDKTVPDIREITR